LTLSQAQARVHGETLRGDVRLDARIAAADSSGSADLAGTRLEVEKRA